MNIKPIETKYSGCFFRSRLEARWAVFFNTLGWRWEYEPERFKLPHGGYLPDFRISVGSPLKSRGIRWFEVKPYKGPECPIDPRWQELCEATKTPFMTVYGMHRTGDGCEKAWNEGKASPHAGRVSIKGETPSLLGPFWTGPEFKEAWDAASSERFGW